VLLKFSLILIRPFGLALPFWEARLGSLGHLGRKKSCGGAPKEARGGVTG
jgi:hypothetical protein